MDGQQLTTLAGLVTGLVINIGVLAFKVWFTVTILRWMDVL